MDRVGLGKLHEIRHTLLFGGRDTVHRCLRQAAEFLAHATSREILGDVIRNRRQHQRLLSIVTGLDHVGFVSFQGAGSDLESVADAAGFDDCHWSFPSRIFARELGYFTGTDIVPTSIFKARGMTVTGHPMAVEVFLPQPIDAFASRDWIERGRAVHAAFAISEPKRFRDVIEIMTDEGFRPPEFTRGEPLLNEVENVIALYFDGELQDQPVRIEFCHFR